MAFIFVPNADGGFTEGDKQTNPDTGVEYIYIDGAWRALGPKIEDEFDTLDERYVNVTGDTIQGQLYFDLNEDGQHNLGITPGRDNTAILFSMNNGITRLRSLADNNINSNNVRTHFGWGRDNAGNPQTVLYWLADPGDSHHAVNLSYLESYVAEQIDAIDVGDINLDEALADYLPLTGGELTGDLTIKNKYFYVENNTGEEKFRVQGSGFCRSLDLFRSERTDNGPGFQARNNNTLNAEIRCDGRATFKTSVKKDNKELATEEHVSNNYLSIGGGTLTGVLQFNRGNKDNYQFKISPNSGSDFATNIYSVSNGQMRFRTSHTNNEGDNIGSHIVLDPANGTPTTKIYKVVTPTANDMAANKSYVDGKVGGGRFYVQDNALYYEMP